MGFLPRKIVLGMGFKYIGNGVAISEKTSIYQPENISIGDNTRIDDFVVISAGEGGVSIGRNVHIAVYTSLIGRGKISIEDFSNISSRVSIYSNNDDYSGNFMTNPTVDNRFTKVEVNDVCIGKHVIIGSGSVILPGVTLEDGVAVGALSLVKAGNYKKFGIYGGIPSRFIKKRSRRLLELEKDIL
ncbi:MAG: Hexapeptide repeat-containing transferase [Candidatus Woesebacteria bacterium GW2011_GWC1_38_13]|uniref:Hexapeptide repeat-containing transferase n=2 Tax=Candidatus Woeseibacteriota TaxID=1752722 RepID=A0A0G0LW96_9BACT|nr:MAG: Hexapeptide repeat-containing transferase [Candidatus Woesebacteria bacterium GW2011_GWD1_38_10]KKQ56821.1 MAG: Hexapeptide repeat-containing transferase [Candidatus Woesebacteria bacterium GW2011_GWC1_38_13]